MFNFHARVLFTLTQLRGIVIPGLTSHGSNCAQRALEEWERTLCENKAVAILAEIQAGRPTIIHKDGGEMLIAIVLDRPLAEAKELVDDPAAFTREMTRILRDKQTHPLIAQMMKPAESSDPPPATAAASGASSSGEPRTTSHEQFQ